MKWAAAGIVLLIFFSACRTTIGEEQSLIMTPTAAAERVAKSEAVLVDVREPEEWQDGVAASAYLLPLSDLRGEREQWDAFLREMEGKEIILYCRSGNRSGIAAGILAEEGFQVRNAGGFRDWQAAGLPERKPEEPRAEGETTPTAFINPYENVNWEKIGYYDANLHTHTNLSDGQHDPHHAIDKYHDLDYEILALTDHDSLHEEVWPRALYPWTELSAIYHEIKDKQSVRFKKPYREVVDEEWQNRDPKELGMVSIPGSEISRTNHISSLFNHYAGGTDSEEIAFQEIAKRSGLAVFNHPGRYKRSIDWYVDHFTRHPHVVGMEVYNQVDRFPVDRKRWDNILYRLMPERPVWGIANDDTHGDAHYGRNRNIFLLTGLTEERVFAAMKNGHFYFFVPVEQGVPPPVRLTNVKITENTIHLEIEGGYERIDWITYNPATDTSDTLTEGHKFSLDVLPPAAPYVRAVIISKEGRTYTQPFGINTP